MNGSFVNQFRYSGRSHSQLGLAALLMLYCGLFVGIDSLAAGKKVMVLGIDGMDPKLLETFVDQGRMPNFKALMAEGDFRPLQTTMPPQSPVAWSTFMTGMDPGGHGIFDFRCFD